MSCSGSCTCICICSCSCSCCIYLPIYLSTYLSYSILFYPILSYPILSYLPSYPILSYPILSYPSIYLFVCLSVCLPASLKTQQFCETSSALELENIKSAAILRDFLNFWTWQHQNRNNSARLPHFLKLTTKKMQFCETSFKNGKLCAELTASYQCVLRFFHSTCLKYCACHEKSDARSYEVLHLSRKIIFPKLTIWCSKMQPLSGNRRPDLLTSLMNMSLVLRLPRKMHLCRSSSNVPHLPSFLEMPQNPHVLLTFDKVHNPLRLPRKTTKSGPNMQCFVHFDLEIYFAPQRRATFHLSSDHMASHPPL